MDSDPLLSHALTGVVDYRGCPASRDATGRWTSALFIIGVEIAERFAFYGVSSNLISFLTGPLRESTAAAAAAVNVWSGWASMLPLLGAFLADSYLGRYRTIVIATLLYILGLGSLTLLSSLPSSLLCPTDPVDCTPSPVLVTSFYASLYLMAFAQGGHKPCVQAFGADQFDENDPGECVAKSSFFNWWYMGMSSGVLVAIVVLSYIQDYVSWALGFGIPCTAMVIALVVFLIGTKTYRFYPIKESRTVTCMEKDLDAAEEDNQRLQPKQCASSLGEEIKGLLRLFPTWATCLTYAIVFAQSPTLFTKQGSTLDRRIGFGLEAPPAALQVFSSIAILTSILIYDRVLVPVARKLTKHPSGITMLQRIGAGMTISLVGIVIAAMVEMKRLQIAKDYGLVDQPDATVPMSVWWLVPQYILCGVSDVFTMVGLQEFFYDQVPDALRSLGLALYLSIFGIGSFISGFLVSAIDKASSASGDSWFSNNLNRAHLDYFYWLLAGLSAFGLLLYLHFSLAYVYKKERA
ncbi:protein NRT1/ PTR FAMILY 5.10 [Canna indica]|uniref:Protein NRT1/ PTR FAMILY 5.10 n=1 Tax=Canna indica TaxID=4628 RepID=A0AAQ3Q3E0_9LILI|nr:protein NRT1/ PTR FAMILY 5.10 [Canna indica]